MSRFNPVPVPFVDYFQGLGVFPVGCNEPCSPDLLFNQQSEGPHQGRQSDGEGPPPSALALLLVYPASETRWGLFALGRRNSCSSRTPLCPSRSATSSEPTPAAAVETGATFSESIPQRGRIVEREGGGRNQGNVKKQEESLNAVKKQKKSLNAVKKQNKSLKAAHADWVQVRPGAVQPAFGPALIC